ncbi:MAG TPA: DUF4198 domain-containing protein [Cyclobacteriaceae bacterium]|nr:DUF4198 domain-containing protein [Cyclobacteriaceae bacterium]
MKKGVITLSLIFLLRVMVQSHEFWLQPQKFRYALGEEMIVDFVVGESFEGEPWDLKKNKIEKLELSHLAGVVDLRQQVKIDAKEKLKYKFTEEGTYLLSMQSNSAYIELAADKFNDYLKEDGLENVVEIRTRTNTLDKPSKEFYSRHVKLLVQAGAKTADTFKKKTGMRIEIIPQQNPYLLKSGHYLQCLVLFDGKPLAHQMVKVWNKIGNASILQNTYTEDDGMVKFPISSRGPWMVSTVRMIPSEKPGADWQSFWSSLVFGIE